MLAEEHQVVAHGVRGERRVAMIRPVAVAVREIELRLRPAEIAGARRILVAALLAEEITRHVLDRIEAKAVAARLIDRPADRADEHRIHILRDGIAHVVAPVAKTPRRGLTRGVGRIDARVRECLARFSDVVLAIPVRIRPVEAPVPVRIHERLLVRERVKDHAVRVGHAGQIVIRIKRRLARRAARRTISDSLALRFCPTGSKLVFGSSCAMSHANGLRFSTCHSSL